MIGHRLLKPRVCKNPATTALVVSNHKLPFFYVLGKIGKEILRRHWRAVLHHFRKTAITLFFGLMLATLKQKRVDGFVFGSTYGYVLLT